MFEFLLDIVPGKCHMLISIGLAEALQEKKQEVYYTHTPNPAFTSALYQKGIGNSVIYPEDFDWLRPDLILLDCQHANRAPFYRQRSMDYIFVAMQLPDRESNLDTDIPMLYLPPALSSSSASGPRMEELMARLKEIKRDRDRHVIIGLMERGDSNRKGMDEFYKVIKSSCLKHPQYQFMLLTNASQSVRQLFELPENMEIFRMLNLDAVLPLCDLALTATHPDAWLDCTFAHVPVLAYSPEEMKNTTPLKLDRQIKQALQNKVMLTQKAKELCDFFERENQNLDRITNMLIKRAEHNRYNRQKQL